MSSIVYPGTLLAKQPATEERVTHQINELPGWLWDRQLAYKVGMSSDRI